MENKSRVFLMLNRNDSVFLFVLIIILVFFSLTSLYSYLLFHTLTELFSIVIAAAIFIVAWNSRDFIDNSYLLFIGIAFLFIGGIDFLHTLAYSGMNIFTGFDANLPTQLWIAGRYLQAATFIAAALLISRRINVYREMAVYLIIFCALVITIFEGIFPTCYIEGQGLTTFKIVSEYIISLMLVLSAYLLYRQRENFEPRFFNIIILSIFFTILSELAFTFYISVYGFSNLVGHLFKIIAFALIYYAMVESGIRRPYENIFRNLTKKEREITIEHDKLKMYLDVAGVMFVVLDNEGIVNRINPKCCEILGYNEDEIVGKNWFDNFIPKKNRTDVKNIFSKIISGELEPFLSVEGDILTKNGEIRTILFQNSIIRNKKGKIEGTLSSGEDITSRKQAENEILFKNIILSTQQEVSPDGILVVDEHGKIISFNHIFQDIWDIPDDIIVSRDDKPLLSYVHKKVKHPDEFIDRIKYLYDHNEEKSSEEIELLDGRFIDRYSAPMYGKAGKYFGRVWYFRDITVKKQAESLLERNQFAFENSPDEIYFVNREGQIVYANLSSRKSFGIEQDVGASGKTVFDINPEINNEKWDDIWSEILEKGHTRFESLHRRSDGSIYPVDIVKYHIRHENIDYSCTIAHDISDRIKAEEALKEVNKKLNLLSSITRHDILNQITGAAGYIQLLELNKKIPPDSKEAEYIEKISGAVDTIKKQILFTRDYKDMGEQAPDWFDLGEIVTAAYENAAFKEIELKNDLKSIEIFADPLLEKVIYNLFDNAVKHGEKITRISFSAEEMPDGLVITCEDDGIGIPDEAKEKIFRREYYKNSGLGLFLSREILGITGMSIKETGKFGEGARFEINVPEGKYRLTG